MTTTEPTTTTPPALRPVIRPVWIIGFVGHRPKPGVPGRTSEQIESCRAALHEALTECQRQAREAGGEAELHCSLAEGADLLAISIAENLKMPVHIVLPMPWETFRLDYEPQDGEEEPRSLQDATRYRNLALLDDSHWTIRIAEGDNARPACYHDANLQMLETADVLIAICTSEALEEPEPYSLGGTPETIGLAGSNRFGVPAIVLDPANNGVVILPSSADCPTKAANQALKPSLIDPVLEAIKSDLAQPAALVPPTGKQRGDTDPVWDIHCALDNVANSTSYDFRTTTTRSLHLHFTATIIAAVTASFAAVLNGTLHAVPPVLTFIEFAFVFTAFVLVWIARRRNCNPRWRRARFAAEVADSQTSAAGLIDPLRPLVIRHDDRWKRFAIAVGLDAYRQVRQRIGAKDSDERLGILKDTYLKQRIHAQEEYYSSELTKAKSTFHRWHRIQNITLGVAIIAIAISFAAKLNHWKMGGDWGYAFVVLFLPIFLPLLIAFAASMIVANDAARRATRYANVLERLGRFTRIIPSVRTPMAMRRVVAESEDIMLDEVIEWHATAENLEHLH